MKCVYLGLIALFLICRASIADVAQKSPPSVTNVLPKEVGFALDSADTIMLYSLEPLEETSPGEESFRGYKVLGKVKLDRQQTAEVAVAIKKALSAYAGYSPNCFDPRAGVRVKSGGKSYDLLICYQCNGLKVFKGDAVVAQLGVGGTSKVINSFLSGAGIPISTSNK